MPQRTGWQSATLTNTVLITQATEPALDMLFTNIHFRISQNSFSWKTLLAQWALESYEGKIDTGLVWVNTRTVPNR